MKIRVLDGYALNPGDLSWEAIESLGDCHVFDRTPAESILQAAQGAEILLTNKTPLNSHTLQNLPDLKYVGVLATGYNVVDTDTAKERGIPVTNIPSYGPESVAQMAIAHVMNLSRRVAYHADTVRTGRWARDKDWCYWDHPQIELTDKILGIVGLGTIGLATTRIAQALGMKILANRKSNKPMPKGIQSASLDEIFTQSDFISLHCPLTSETENLVNADRLSQMKASAFLINTSRGPLIDEKALYAVLKSRQIAGAGLDVLRQEPPCEGNPLFELDNCHITPHIAWATQNARQRLMETASQNLRSWIQGKPQNVVNP